MICSWTSINLWIAMPTLRGISPETCGTIANVVAALRSRGASCEIVASRAPLMSVARGALFYTFLEGPGTHCLALDDDISFRQELLDDLLAADEPMVGAAYRIKQNMPDDPHHEYAAGMSEEQHRQEPKRNGTIQVRRLGGGCILYQRHVVEKLRDQYGVLNWGEGRALRACLEACDQDGNLLTEDYVLCERWYGMGGEVRALLDAETCHGDGARLYRGNLKDYLRYWREQQEKKQEQQTEKLVERASDAVVRSYDEETIQ